MASADLKRTRALVARYLDPGARWSAADDRALRDLCRADEASAAEYDRQVTLYRELVGADPMLPSGHEQQRMMAAVLDAVPVMVTESAFAPEPTPSPLLRWLRPMMGVLAGACALLAVVVGMSDDSIGLRVPDEAIVNARGSGFFDLTVGVGISGVTEDGREYEAVHGDGVYMDDYMRLYATRAVEDWPLMLVVGLQPGQAPIWYHPDPEHGTERSQRVELGKSIPLGGANEPFEFKVSGRHVTGALKVVGIFSGRAVTVERVAAALADYEVLTRSMTGAVGGRIGLDRFLEIRLGLESDGIIRILEVEVQVGSKVGEGAP